MATAATAASLAAPAYASITAPALLGRDNSCPGNYYQCPTSLDAAFSGICCRTGQTCAFDAEDSPACCPSGAVCTGNAPTSQPAASTGATQPASYVPNSYFSFPYAPTSFNDAGACSSAVSACSQNLQVCISDLSGGNGNGYGVTIVVPGGGGVTMQPTDADLGTSATSVCSSLSSAACSGLDDDSCGSFSASSAASQLKSTTPGVVFVAAVAWLIATNTMYLAT